MIGVEAGTMQAEAAARESFIGVWRLVSFEQKFPDGRAVFAYGEKPVGRITYDNAGRMSAQLMRPGRRSAVTPAGALIDGKASGEEIREAVAGFLAYFGTFDVDELSQTVIHHIEACLIPSWVGTDLKRTYRFNGNRLVLTTGGAGRACLTWSGSESGTEWRSRYAAASAASAVLPGLFACADLLSRFRQVLTVQGRPQQFNSGREK
jgi:hypothetical protein